MQRLLRVIFWWYPDQNMRSHYFLEQDYCRECSQPSDLARWAHLHPFFRLQCKGLFLDPFKFTSNGYHKCNTEYIILWFR